MPQLNTLVLKNSADADVTFNPRDITGGIATLVSSTGVPIGDKRVTISHSRTTTGREKVTMKIVLPVVQDVVVAGISKPTVVRAAYADIVLTFDGTSNATEREDMLAACVSLLADPLAFDLAVALETLY